MCRLPDATLPEMQLDFSPLLYNMKSHVIREGVYYSQTLTYELSLFVWSKETRTYAFTTCSLNIFMGMITCNFMSRHMEIFMGIDIMYSFMCMHMYNLMSLHMCNIICKFCYLLSYCRCFRPPKKLLLFYQAGL